MTAQPSRLAFRLAMSRRRLAVASLVVLVGGGLAAAPTATAGSMADAARVYRDGRTLRVGDVVAVGKPAGQGCVFTGFGLSLGGSGIDEGYVVDLRLDAACALVVRESAARVVTPDVDEPVVPENDAPQAAGALSFPSGQKTVHNYVWMYGYGGPDDRLTVKEGRLTYTYSNNIVWLTSQSGGCSSPGFGPYWQWLHDSCVVNETGSQAGRAWRKGTGSYHCDSPSVWPCNISSPDGYYHSLIDEENGYPNGTYLCNAWYSGQIVAGSLFSCTAS